MTRHTHRSTSALTFTLAAFAALLVPSATSARDRRLPKPRADGEGGDHRRGLLLGHEAVSVSPAEPAEPGDAARNHHLGDRDWTELRRSRTSARW